MTINLTIIILTSIVSYMAFNNEKLREDLLFWPYMAAARNQHYRFLSGGAIHADFMHLVFNMFSLYSFGNALESILLPAIFGHMARMHFAILYLAAIIVSCIPDYFIHKNDIGYRALGASGAVSAVIYSAITIVPTMPIRFIFIPIDIPGYIFGFIFLALSYYMAKRGGDHIGHNAHFWGAVFGIVYTIVAARVFADVDLVDSFLRSVMP